MVLMGELASFIIAAMMGRRSAAEEGGSFLDLLYLGLTSDGDLDLALRLPGDEGLLVGDGDLVLVTEEGEDEGMGNSLDTSFSLSDISSSMASTENLL